MIGKAKLLAGNYYWDEEKDEILSKLLRIFRKHWKQVAWLEYLYITWIIISFKQLEACTWFKTFHEFLTLYFCFIWKSFSLVLLKIVLKIFKMVLLQILVAFKRKFINKKGDFRLNLNYQNNYKNSYSVLFLIKNSFFNFFYGKHDHWEF